MSEDMVYKRDEKDEPRRRSIAEHTLDRLSIISGIDDSRLRELCAAERDGRVVVRPFKNGQIVFVINEGEIYKCTVDYCGNDCIAISHKKYYSSFDDEFVPYICKVISDTEKEPPTFETEAEAAALAAAGKE